MRKNTEMPGGPVSKPGYFRIIPNGAEDLEQEKLLFTAGQKADLAELH